MNNKALPRFIEKIRFTRGGCWLWESSVSGGYGMFWYAGKARMAHRLSYGHWNGPLCDGHVIDHMCQVKLCVNPDHLEQVTQAENIDRHFGNRPGFCRKDLHDLRIPGNANPSGGYCYQCADVRLGRR